MTSWKVLRGRLAAGAVLRHAAGLRNPVAPERYCPFHSHRWIEIVWHPTGRGVTAVEGGEAVEFGEGEAVLYAPGVMHDQRMSEPGEDCCVQLEAPRGMAIGARGCLHAGRVDDVLLRAEIEFLSRRMAGGTAAGAALLNLRATAVLLQLLELAFERRERTDRAERHARAAERYVQEHYASIGSVEEIARAAGLGCDYLRHVFRRRRGRSLVGYLGEIRVARAKTLLAHSNLPLKEVAGLCGYRDEYYFSAVFRKAEGLPPGSYRERSRPE